MTDRLRILFVFAWLVVGGEETEVRLLAKQLDPRRYRIDVIACFRQAGMPDLMHAQLEAVGVAVDTIPYHLSFEDTVAYLARKMEHYDLVVGCQAVRDLYPALALMERRPALIEHGGLVCEALTGPKHWTARYVGVCATIRDAAAARMAGRPHHAIEIPSMVDVTEFEPRYRRGAREDLGIADDVPLVGWVGRLDRKKRVEDFIAAAAIVREHRSDARFVIVGGRDSFMPEYADELRDLTQRLGLSEMLVFLGDRSDVPRLLSALDVFIWLSGDEGMPHVIAEAGAASLPVIATRDNGTEEQIRDGKSGLFVPHEDPRAVAHAMLRLIENPSLRKRLGSALRAKVERDYDARAVARLWEELFDEVIAEHKQVGPAAQLGSVGRHAEDAFHG